MRNEQTTSPRVLWVSAHPEPGSLNGSLRAIGVRALEAGGHEVVESDLYRLGWDPVVRPEGLVTEGERFRVTQDQRRAFLEDSQPADVRQEQQKIREADAVVLQFPLWWYGMPALLKGWFDRVLVSGFAFGKDPGTGRRLRFEQGPFRRQACVRARDARRPPGGHGSAGQERGVARTALRSAARDSGVHGYVRAAPMAVPSADLIDAEGFIHYAQVLERRLGGLFTEDPLPYRSQFQGDYTDAWELAEHVRPGETGLSVHLVEAGERA